MLKDKKIPPSSSTTQQIAVTVGTSSQAAISSPISVTAGAATTASITSTVSTAISITPNNITSNKNCVTVQQSLNNCSPPNGATTSTITKNCNNAVTNINTNATAVSNISITSLSSSTSTTSASKTTGDSTHTFTLSSNTNSLSTSTATSYACASIISTSLTTNKSSPNQQTNSGGASTSTTPKCIHNKEDLNVSAISSSALNSTSANIGDVIKREIDTPISELSPSPAHGIALSNFIKNESQTTVCNTITTSNRSLNCGTTQKQVTNIIGSTNTGSIHVGSGLVGSIAHDKTDSPPSNDSKYLLHVY